jgi:hypothetical protein
MKKSDVLNWLQEEHKKWEALLKQIGPTRMEQAGVNGDWSMKELVGHLNGWNRKLVARFQAAQRGEPEPTSPWPQHLQTDDEINAWIYETNRERSLQEVLNEAQQVNQQILTVVENLPENVRVEIVEPAYHLVWLGNERYQPGEFFDHFRDDHEANVRAWLARE